MQYRKGAGADRLSSLAFGCMRLPRKGAGIDMDLSTKLIEQALDAGVNLFDTAYIYPGIEAAVGEVFSKLGRRSEVYLTSKLPVYLIKKTEHLDKYFDETLRRLKTDYVDYYFMHMLSDTSTWERLKALGIEEWIEKQKASGRIRHIGFSFHGPSSAFLPLVDAYPWEFCMIQYNYMDEHSQAGKRGLLHAHEKGIPVFIMEPLRGGRLVQLLPDSAKKLIEQNGNGQTAAELAFRWLYNQSEITSVLSGMNSLEMLTENIRIATETVPGSFSEADFALVESIKQEIARSVKVGCTGCAYCMPCPKGVDIPGTFTNYNAYYSESKFSGLRDYFQCTVLRHEQSSASQCVGCGLCEKHCPQEIEIRKMLKEAEKKLEFPGYKVAKWVVKKAKIY